SHWHGSRGRGGSYSRWPGAHSASHRRARSGSSPRARLSSRGRPRERFNNTTAARPPRIARRGLLKSGDQIGRWRANKRKRDREKEAGRESLISSRKTKRVVSRYETVANKRTRGWAATKCFREAVQSAQFRHNERPVPPSLSLCSFLSSLFNLLCLYSFEAVADGMARIT
ncbi:hypothetical protein CH063_04430, partial [Colletotrichum higginsianum]